MKKGWLVVNGFLQSAKFGEIYRFLLNAAKENGAEISLFTSDRFITGEINGFSQWGKPDFVLFWDKDVTLAKLLEQAGFKLFNGAKAVETCDSKILTALALKDKVPMPETLFSPKTFENVGYTNFEFAEQAVAVLGLPLVIKEACGSFGQQVYLAKTLQEAVDIVKNLSGKDFVFQRFISESYGKDVRLNVVGGKVVNAVLRQSSSDFRSNVTLGGKISPYDAADEQISVAECACEILGLDFAGVDVLLGKDGPLLCEVNSNPHFKSTYDSTGVDISKHILRHICRSV